MRLHEQLRAVGERRAWRIHRGFAVLKFVMSQRIRVLPALGMRVPLRSDVMADQSMQGQHCVLTAQGLPTGNTPLLQGNRLFQGTSRTMVA